MVQAWSVLLWLRAGSLLASPRHAVFHGRSKILQNRYRFLIQGMDRLDIGPRWMVRIPSEWLFVRSTVETVDLVLWRYRVFGRNGFDHGRAITRLFREYRNVSELVVCESNGRPCAECLRALTGKFVGRFFIGWAVGGLSAVVPLYNSEISSAAVRGTVVSIQQLAIVTGICISFWVGFGTNYISDTNSVSWRLCLAIQGVPALMLCAGCRESALSFPTRASLISV